MKGTTMISRLSNTHFGIAGARGMITIPILVIALAFATLVTLQSGTAFADTGTPTTCDSHNDFDCIETELGESPQTELGTTTEQVRTNHHPDPDHGEDINTGASCDHGIFGLCIPI